MKCCVSWVSLHGRLIRVSEAHATEVAFVGLGNMGRPMARRLVAASFGLRVMDAAPGVAARFAAEVGGRAVDVTPESVDGVDVLLTMLPSSAEVAAVLHAVAPGMRHGALVIEMSSGNPSITRSLSVELKALGIDLVDCPVSGGVGKAETGELSVMAGGAPDHIERARPVLEALSARVMPCGGVGSGQAMKALNNLVSAAGLLATVEALLIGQASGLDPAVMVDVLDASTGMNNSTRNKIKPFVLSRSFDSGFGLDLLAKDLRIAMDLRAQAAVATPLVAAVEQLFAAAVAVVGPGMDHTAIAKFSETLAGFELLS